jgi:acetyltransferase-like isoleucine patch superfamily enzyme
MSLFDKIIYHWHYSKLNIVKTILVNFKTLPFSHAIKFPIFIYGGLDIYFLLGKVEFHKCEVTKGMIKMGFNKEYLGIDKRKSLLILKRNAKLNFYGNCEFSSNFLIRIEEDAQITLGKNTFFGNSMKMVALKNITIGNYTQFAFESQILDSDFHYLHDITKDELRTRDLEVIIGEYNWFGNRTTVLKGTKTKPYTTVASGSITKGNFLNTNGEYLLLAGNPAKLIAMDIKRIFPLITENNLVQFYKNPQNQGIKMNDKIRKILNEIHNSN